MKIIPYKKYYYKILLSQADFYHRMASFVLFDEYGKNSWFENIYRRDKNYIGSFQIDSFDQTHFIIEPKTILTTQPYYRVKGKIVKIDKDIHVELVLSLPKYSFLTMSLFYLFGLVFVFFDRLVNFTGIELLKSQLIFIVPLILFMITNLAFQYSSNFFIADFKDNFGENVEIIRKV